jgi:hypothetical protein
LGRRWTIVAQQLFEITRGESRRKKKKKVYLAVGAGRGEAMQLRWWRLAAVAVAGDVRRRPAALCSLSGAGRARLEREQRVAREFDASPCVPQMVTFIYLSKRIIKASIISSSSERKWPYLR